MNRTKGFTLLEVLVVVVIAASVLLFAVPAYKRMQDKTTFMAAQGVLIDLGSAVRALRLDFSLCATPVLLPSGSTPLAVSNRWQDSTSTSYQNVEKQADLCTLSPSKAPIALFAQKYMEPISFNQEAGALTDQYKYYGFYICPQGQASSAQCCNNDKQVVVCMQDTSTCSRPTKGLYHGARFLQDGTVQTFSKSNCPTAVHGEEVGRI